MSSARPIRIKNLQRQEHRQKRKEKENWYVTPPKYILKKYIGWKVGSMAEKFGYDYSCGSSRTLKYMQEQFEYKSASYYEGHQKPKIWKNKDKYEQNILTGKPFKKNPLIKIFDKVQKKIQNGDKLVAFHAIRSYAF